MFTTIFQGDLIEGGLTKETKREHEKVPENTQNRVEKPTTDTN